VAGAKKTHPLDKVNDRIVACRKCPRLVEHREHIGRVKRRAYRDHDYWARAIPGFGDPHARLLIVGLAPAAHGANRTGRIFTGDRSGDWLYRALHRAGFANQEESVSRDDGLRLNGAYITAAARCAPPGNKPTREELALCRPYLLDEMIIFREQAARAARPLVLLALGQIGYAACLESLQAVGVEIPRPRPKFGHCAVHEIERGITVVCSYHPSQQNTQTGRLTRVMFQSVFTKAKKLL